MQPVFLLVTGSFHLVSPTVPQNFTHSEMTPPAGAEKQGFHVETFKYFLILTVITITIAKVLST